MNGSPNPRFRILANYAMNALSNVQLCFVMSGILSDYHNDRLLIAKRTVRQQ